MVNSHKLYALVVCTAYALLNFVDGRGGVAELQPLVLRFFDADYLKYDFFVNSADIYNARFYIVRYLSIFAYLFGIDYGMHIAGIFSLIATLVAVYLIAYKVTNSEFSSFVALLLAMVPRNMGVELGEWYLISNQIGANQLVMPLVIWGIYFIYSQKTLSALSLFSILSIFHPLLGLEMLVLFALYVVLFGDSLKIKAIVILVVVLILGFHAIALNSIRDMFFLSSDSLREILVEYRHPHHYLVFNKGIVPPLFFSVLLFISWKILRHSSHVSMSFTNTFLVVMIPLSVAAIISIEYYPLRIAITSVPFRLLSVIGYLFIIIASSIAISRVIPASVIDGNIFHLARKGRYALLSILVALSIAAFSNIQSKRLLVLNNVISDLVPFDQEYNDLVHLSKTIEKVTEKDSIIITNISEIKHLSNRATFEGSQFPFVDQYMYEWYKRKQDLDLSSDKGLINIQRKYSLPDPVYALIGLEQKTRFQTVYCGKALCLVRL